MQKITVTQHDITKGTPGNPTTCTIALAAKRAGYKSACVGRGRMNYKRNKLLTDLELPLKARDFLRKFDSLQQVAPFTFTPINKRIPRYKPLGN